MGGGVHSVSTNHHYSSTVAQLTCCLTDSIVNEMSSPANSTQSLALSVTNVSTKPTNIKIRPPLFSLWDLMNTATARTNYQAMNSVGLFHF